MIWLLLTLLAFAGDPATPTALEPGTSITLNGRTISLEQKHWLVSRKELQECIIADRNYEEAKKALEKCSAKKDEMQATCIAQLTEDQQQLLADKEEFENQVGARHKCEATNLVLVDTNKKLRRQRNGAYAAMGGGAAVVVAVITTILILK